MLETMQCVHPFLFPWAHEEHAEAYTKLSSDVIELCKTEDTLWLLQNNSVLLPSSFWDHVMWCARCR